VFAETLSAGLFGSNADRPADAVFGPDCAECVLREPAREFRARMPSGSASPSCVRYAHADGHAGATPAQLLAAIDWEDKARWLLLGHPSRAAKLSDLYSVRCRMSVASARGCGSSNTKAAPSDRAAQTSWRCAQRGFPWTVTSWRSGTATCSARSESADSTKSALHVP
jgi:hypothetical protein